MWLVGLHDHLAGPSWDVADSGGAVRVGCTAPSRVLVGSAVRHQFRLAWGLDGGYQLLRDSSVNLNLSHLYLDRVKLSEWAARNGVHYQTAWAWAKQGRMPVPVRQTPSGTWLVDEPVSEASGRVVAYCRVWSADQKPDLDRQVARVVQGATGLGLPVAEVVTEVGSGLNGRRRRLHGLLSDPQAAVIVVEHRDRLARFGVEHLEAVLAASGRRLVVLDPAETAETAETADDLVRDITEVLTSMCARLYGRRAAKNRAARAVAVATGEAAE
jgi:putative resolvase